MHAGNNCKKVSRKKYDISICKEVKPADDLHADLSEKINRAMTLLLKAIRIISPPFPLWSEANTQSNYYGEKYAC